MSRLVTFRTRSSNLRLLAHSIRTEGRGQLIGYLAAELRALRPLQEKDDQKESGYNPLLLRMADLGKLPLPVFSRKATAGPGPAVPSDAVLIVDLLQGVAVAAKDQARA